MGILGLLIFIIIYIVADTRDKKFWRKQRQKALNEGRNFYWNQKTWLTDPKTNESIDFLADHHNRQIQAYKNYYEKMEKFDNFKELYPTVEDYIEYRLSKTRI